MHRKKNCGESVPLVTDEGTDEGYGENIPHRSIGAFTLYIYIYIYLRVYIICIKINLCTNHVFSLFGTCYSFPSRGLQRR